MLVPTVSLDRDSLLLIVAVLGTTNSPYLFFWQASQEVEEMRNKRVRARLPLKILSRGGGGELTRISIDTSDGMVLANLVAYFIIIATASTLHAHGITYIQTAAQAAEVLRPIAGDLLLLWGLSEPDCLPFRCLQARPPMRWRNSSDGLRHSRQNSQRPSDFT